MLDLPGAGSRHGFDSHQTSQSGDYVVWELDFQAVLRSLADLRLQGVGDIAGYLRKRPEQLDQLFSRVRVASTGGGPARAFAKSRFAGLSWAAIMNGMSPEAKSDILVALDTDRGASTQRVRFAARGGRRCDGTLSIIFPQSRRLHAVACLAETEPSAGESAPREEGRSLLSELRKLARNVSRTENEDTMIRLFLKSALKIAEADHCLLLRPESSSRRGRLGTAAFARATRTKLKTDGAPDPLRLEFGMAFFNVSEPRLFQVPGSSGYGLPTIFNGELPPGSYLAVPFACENGSQTCSILLAKAPGQSYPPDVVDALSTLSTLANLSLDRGFMARQAKKDRERYQRDFAAAQQLAAVVQSSIDAILTTDLEGRIASWNKGARRLYGYEAAEALGQPVTILIPPEHQEEEAAIRARVWAGNRVEHYETERLRKDGSRLMVSLTMSPVRNLEGEIIGASKVARDITEDVRAKNLQRLLLQEMDHRIKNLFALCGSIVSLCGQKASTPRELVQTVRSRFMALARAHDLVFLQSRKVAGASGSALTPGGPIGLHGLLETVLAPFQEQLTSQRRRIEIRGANPDVSGSSVATLALLAHEFATNATKYGSLGQAEGRIDIDCVTQGEMLSLIWRETGDVVRPPDDVIEGFGSVMTRAAVENQLNGEIARRWGEGGVEIEITLPLDRLRDM